MLQAQPSRYLPREFITVQQNMQGLLASGLIGSGQGQVQVSRRLFLTQQAGLPLYGPNRATLCRQAIHVLAVHPCCIEALTLQAEAACLWCPCWLSSRSMFCEANQALLVCPCSASSCRTKPLARWPRCCSPSLGRVQCC